MMVDQAEPKIEMRAAHELRPYGRNSRTHSEEQILLLMKSIREYGFTNPILISDDGTIVAGHARYIASQRLGMATVPCIRLSHLSETQLRAYCISDNAIPAYGTGWDLPLLRAEIGDLKALDFDLPLLGFDSLQMVEFVSGLGNGGQSPAGSGNGSLAEAFGVPPFSVLNAREGWWQDRKRAWIALGIQSELGRGGEGQPNAVPGGGTLPNDRPDYRQDLPKR